MRRPALARVLPAAGWLPRYERRFLRGDLAAGIAVTALIVPKDLGYAGIAGVPLENGLYAAAAGAIVYALFCTSRQISTGPSSSLAAVAGGAVVAAGIAGDQAAELVAAIAVVTGLLFLALALLRLGWISRFLSKAVVTGFLAGAAVDVVVGELSKLTGTDAEGDNAWREFGSWLGSLGDVHWADGGRRRARAGADPRAAVPRPRRAGRARARGGGDPRRLRVGPRRRTASRSSATCRAGCRRRSCPTLDLVKEHMATVLVASSALVLIGFSQTAGDARAFAARHRYRIDVDQESVAQGMANVGAGVFQGMPVSTSLSASSLNESAGARTPVASLITGALVLLTLLFLAPLFSNLPKAVLAAVIIDAVVFGMIDVPELRRLRRVARFDFWIAVAAIVGVLSSGVLAGVVIGVALSLDLAHPRRGDPADRRCSGASAGPRCSATSTSIPDDETFPGIVVLRLDSGLFFATAQALEDRVREFAEDGSAPLEAVVLDLEGVNFIDSQGAEQLTAIHELVASHDATLRLARVKPPVLAVLRADGFIELARCRPHPRQRASRRRGGSCAYDRTPGRSPPRGRAARVHRRRDLAPAPDPAGDRVHGRRPLVGTAGLGWIDVAPDAESLKLLAEATLALVLFADASRIDLRALRDGYALPARLLGIGLPLTIVAGTLAALVVLPELAWEEALVLAIVLAATDAALGQAVVTDERLPTSLRQGLNVESGLNDGLCVPGLVIALTLADTAADALSGSEAARVIAESIGYGVLMGAVAGAVAAAISAPRHDGRRRGAGPVALPAHAGGRRARLRARRPARRQRLHRELRRRA